MACQIILKADILKDKILILSLLLLLNIPTNKVFAVSAYPYPILLKQPDNTELTIQLIGDEFFHYSQTIDGLLIQQNGDGIFEYIELNSSGTQMLSGVKANDETKRTEKESEFTKKLKEVKIKENWLNAQQIKFPNLVKENRSKVSLLNTTLSVTGTKKVLCILIGFQDRAFSKTQGQFNNLMNQSGYNSTGSVKDFYLENSYGQLNLDVTVVGPYVADFNMAFYGANNAAGDDSNPQALIVEALQKANPSVNYADFDNDGDGKVDGVHVIFAGFDEAAGASPNAIWSHRWSINGITLDGKLITDYSCSSELRSNSGSTICGIGTACHEMGHVFGSSDFYDTNNATNEQYIGTGSWDLMASGNWNGGTDRPAHFNPYTKTQTFQWATVQNISSNQQITLYPANSNSNSFYRINTFTPNEYFLIENRQKLGFDTGLPGDGMLVYHVHSLFNGNSQTNNITHPQRFYPICASATQNPTSTPSSYGSINSAECPFPGSSNKTSLTRQTIPSLISWAGAGTGFDLLSISKNGNNITFNANTYFSITGSTRICNQETYTINDLPTGATVSWGSNPTGVVTFQPNGNSVIVTKNCLGSIISLTAQITVNGATCNLSKGNISVGQPLTITEESTLGLNYSMASDAYEIIAGSGNYKYSGKLVVNDYYGLATNYSWEKVTGSTTLPISWFASNNSVNVNSKVSGKMLILSCTASNSCGSFSKEFAFYTGLSPLFAIYPNPATTSVTVTLNEEAETTTTIMLTSTTTRSNSYDIQLWNSTSLVKIISTDQKSTQVSLNGLPRGIYYLHLIKNKEIIEKQILIVN